MGVFIKRGWQCNIKIEYNVSHISTSQQVKYKIRKSDPVFIIFVGKLKKTSLAPPLEQFPLTHKVKNTLCQGSVEYAECGVRSAECGVRSAECGVRSAECGVRSAECGVRSAECRKCGVWKMRSVENEECGK